MKFDYDRAWYCEIKTSVGHTSLLVDTGATTPCLNIADMSEFLDCTVNKLSSIISKMKPVRMRNIDGNETVLYPFELPKIEVGGVLFPKFYCLVSLNTNFKSILGMDVLRCGITNLQFKTIGKCYPFDYSLYEENYSSKPFNRLSFLDYA